MCFKTKISKQLTGLSTRTFWFVRLGGHAGAILRAWLGFGLLLYQKRCLEIFVLNKFQFLRLCSYSRVRTKY